MAGGCCAYTLRYNAGKHCGSKCRDPGRSHSHTIILTDRRKKQRRFALCAPMLCERAFHYMLKKRPKMKLNIFSPGSPRQFKGYI